MTGRRRQGDGSIYQRADGRWSAMLDLGWVDGKRVRRTVSAAMREEVMDKLDELRRVQRAGTRSVCRGWGCTT